MLISLLKLIFGAAFILIGADLLTSGATQIARRFKVSELLIGLTVVALGTSLPELTVSLLSALEGKAEMAVGNVIGSNIFNTLVILGATALICPVRVSKQVIAKDIPWSILAGLILLIVASGHFINGDVNNVITRQSGLLMLCLFFVFIYYTILVAKAENTESDDEEESIPFMPVWKILLFLVIGICGLVFGGDAFVDGASQLAFLMGLSESFVGITIVAAGTSLPELATSVVAALKHKSGMAIGNAIGSNIFNIFLILGVSSSITPLSMGSITIVDLLVQLLCCVIVWFFARTSYTLSRIEGALLLLMYGGYMTYLLIPVL